MGNKSEKTTAADFAIFKNAVYDWQRKLNLMEWSIFVDHGQLVGAYAQTHWDVDGQVARIILCKEWDGLRKRSEHELVALALHEVLHVLIARLVYFATSRWVTQSEFDGVEHALIRRLENMLLELHNAKV